MFSARFSAVTSTSQHVIGSRNVKSQYPDINPVFCRSRVFNRLIEQPVEFFDEEEVGALTSRLGADCQSVARALSSNFNVAFRNGLQCLGDSLPDGVVPKKSTILEREGIIVSI